MPKRKRQVHKEDQKNSIGRLLFVIVAVLLQIVWFYISLVFLVDNYIVLPLFFGYFPFCPFFISSENEPISPSR